MSKLGGSGGGIPEDGDMGDGSSSPLLGLLRKLGTGAAAGGAKSLSTMNQPQQGGGAATQFVAQPNQLSADYYSMLQPQQQQQPRLFR